DNAWMLTSTVLVLLMTIPGLALFYGGLVRSKNMLSVLAQVFYTVCMVTILWALYGYSLAFTGGSDFIGGFSKAFLMGVTPAAKALAAAADGAAKTAAQAKLDEVNADAGWIFKKGAIDFAGGTVVHINAGIAGLVGALLIGKRTGYGKELMAPHSLTMSMIGASLLWVGWFGFNAGSNLEANGGAALAMTNSFVATAAAAMAWMFAEWIVKGHPSVLGALSGAVAGL